jgi:hypothetical protein
MELVDTFNVLADVPARIHNGSVLRARAREACFDEVECSPFNNALPSVVQSVADYPSQGRFQ